MPAAYPTPVIEHVLYDGPYPRGAVFGRWGVFIQTRLGPELVEEVLWRDCPTKAEAELEAAWLEEVLFQK